MMLKDIEWIFFDVGSTLVDESKAYENKIREAIAGTPITYSQFYDTMMVYYRQNKKGDLETIKQFGLTKPAWSTKDEALYPEAKRCLEFLSRSYKIGIIANQMPGTSQRLEQFGVAGFIDLVAASAEEGVSKPDERIFIIALERAGCRAERAVMVGDRLDNDIEPAKRLGMKTIRMMQGFGRYSTPRTESETPDFTAENLDDVCRIFCPEYAAKRQPQ